MIFHAWYYQRFYSILFVPSYVTQQLTISLPCTGYVQDNFCPACEIDLEQKDPPLYCSAPLCQGNVSLAVVYIVKLKHNVNITLHLWYHSFQPEFIKNIKVSGAGRFS